jgi:hypothetical protein
MHLSCNSFELPVVWVPGIARAGAQVNRFLKAYITWPVLATDDFVAASVGQGLL